MSRKKAREVAMKIAFANLLGGDANYRDALLDLAEESGQPEPEASDIAFADALTAGVRKHEQELDTIITGFSKGWEIERLARIDLVLLRLAIYELRYEPDSPKAAVINEAVRMARKFGTESSISFINGLLGAYVRKQEADTASNADSGESMAQ